MPTASRVRTTPTQAIPNSTTSSLEGDILGSGTVSSDLQGGKLNVALYGRNGTGKTTLACCGPGPTAIIAVDPSPTGGARSVSRADVVVYTVAADYLAGRGGRVESLRGSDKVMAIVDAMRKRRPFPFSKVVVDGLNSWSDVILAEIMQVPYNDMPAILGLGKVSGDQYTERSERLIRYLRPIVDLPCDVWLLAQEKDHNPPMNKTTTRSGKEHSRPAQSRLVAEAHPSDQDTSWWSLAIGDAACLYVQNACDFVVRLYDAEEVVEEKLPDVVMNGQTISGGIQLVSTGHRVKRLRCQSHPNYAARFRSPDWRNVPEYIEAPTPEERYQAFLDVVVGKRTKWGKYGRVSGDGV